MQYKRLIGFMLPIFALVVASGCYRATIDTGLASSHRSETIWVHSWVAGLVPPKVINAKNECDHGVAQVETVHTFLQQVVAAVTFSIYTPMTITVTCAEASSAQQVREREDLLAVTATAGYDEIMAAFQVASKEAAKSESPAYVVFEQDLQ